jgi:thiosulfate reductase/polysulfide reductase chain A
MRLGLKDFFPWTNSEEYGISRMKQAGYDCDLLRKDGVILGKAEPLFFEEGAPADFYTESGKIELYSSKLAEFGFDPMPVYSAPEEPPDRYYRLLFGRTPTHTFGRTTNNRLLSEVYSENAVWVNRQVAKQWGLSNGERVYLQNQDGVRSSFSAPVKVTGRIRPDSVFIVHGYGRKARELKFVHGKGIDSSELITRSKVDPIMGGTGMNVNFVTFLRAEDVEAEIAAAATHDKEVSA